MADISVLITQELLRLSEQLIVPTRIYFPSGTVPIEPANIAFDAAWNTTGAAVRRKAVSDGRKKGTAAASVTVTSAATNPEKILLAQYVTQPLRAQTISGSIRGQFRAVESNAAFNGTLQIGIRVVSNDGQTVRATILTVGGSTTTATTPPEFATSLTNRRLLTSGDVTPLPLSSYTCVDGDRLVIEVGVNDKDAGTARTASISFGDNTVDLQTDDTTTTANDPWIEFDTTIQFQNAVDAIRISDSGTTQLMNRGWVRIDEASEVAAAIGLGSALFHQENPRIADTVTAALEFNTTAGPENLKLADGPATGLLISQGLSVTVGQEVLKLADTPLETLNPLETSPSEAIKLADGPITYLPIWLVTAGPENLILDDIGQGLTSLIGVLHIQDTVSAAIVSGNDLSTALAQEVLKLAETLTAARGIEATPSEALKIADSVTADEDRWALVGQEALKVADSVSTTEDPEQANPSEALKVVDTVTAAETSDLEPLVTEALRIADSASGQLTPLQQNTASLEALKIQDSISGELTPLLANLLTDALKIQDTVSAQFVFQASVSESLKISDSASGRLDPIQVITADESLKIADTIQANSTTLQAVVASENVKVSDRVVILSANLIEAIRVIDTGFGQTALLGVIHIQDTVQAQVGGNLSISVQESLRIIETLGAERSPFEATATETVKIGYTQSEVEYTQDEYLKVGDVVAADLAAPSTISTFVAVETLILSDTATMNRDLEGPVTSENLRIADSVSASRGIEATISESGKIADSITVSPDQIASLSEAGRLADSATGTLNPLETSRNELLAILDTLAVNLGNPNDLAVGMGDETVLITDSVTAATGLSVALSEALVLGESLDSGDGTILTVHLTETIKIEDIPGSNTDLRIGLEQEDLGLGEESAATLATPVELETDYQRLDDGFLVVGMDLSTDTTNPEPDPTIVEAYCIITIRPDVRRIIVRAEPRRA